MKKIATALIVMMSVSAVYAESELNQFSSDLDKYNAAQRKTPKHLIQYRDQNGYLLKNLFNPDRIEPIINDALKYDHSAQKLSALIKKIGPIGSQYGTAFRIYPNTYDREWIDQVDVVYKILILMNQFFKDPDTTKNFSAEQKETFKRATRLINDTASSILSEFEKDINSGAFSPQYTTDAIARLAALKQFKRTILTQSTTSSFTPKTTSQPTTSTPQQLSTSVSNASSAPPQLWSSHLQLSMQASACASKGYSVLSTLGMSSIVQNDTYVYGNYDSSRIAVKCVPMNDQSFVYIAVAGPNKELVERLRNDIFYRMK